MKKTIMLGIVMLVLFSLVVCAVDANQTNASNTGSTRKDVAIAYILSQQESQCDDCQQPTEDNRLLILIFLVLAFVGYRYYKT